MLAKKTDTILVSFKEAIPRIKKANNIVCTGTPVKIKKQEYTQQKKQEILQNIGITDEKPIVLVFGGSQGAQKINEAILGIIENKANKDYQIIWASGPKQYDIIREKLEEKNIHIKTIPNTKIVPYIYNMEEIMNISDLIVSRSGAMTITEISNLGKASILIPLPNVSNNHQLYNAQVLENVKAAKIILDKDLQESNLNQTITEILKNNKTKQMGENALKASTQDVENTIYKEIQKLVK